MSNGKGKNVQENGNFPTKLSTALLAVLFQKILKYIAHVR